MKMKGEIYKFIKKKKRASLIKESDLSTEIILKQIDINDKFNNLKDINNLKDETIEANSKKDNNNIVEVNSLKDTVEANSKEVNSKEDSSKEDSSKEDSSKEDSSKEDSSKEENSINDIKEDNKLDYLRNDNKSLSLRDSVLSFVPLSSSVLPSFTEKHCLLPKKYLALTKIFRVMTTIQKYNTNRGLSNIFLKCKKCIEDVLKMRISEVDIERIRYLIPNNIIIKNIEIEGQKTFTYFLECSPEYFNNKIWEYYREIEGNSRKINEDVKDIPRYVDDTKNSIVNEDNIKDKNNNIKDNLKDKNNINYNSKVNEDKINDNINYNNNKIIKDNIKSSNNNIKYYNNNKDKNKYSDILKRLKEKENLRKEEFIAKSKTEDYSAFLKKVDLYLKKDNKKCVKIKEIIKVFNLYDGDRYIRKVVEKENSYEIKTIFNEEYLIKLI